MNSYMEFKMKAISSGKPEGIMPEEKRLSIFFQGEIPKGFAAWLIKNLIATKKNEGH